LLKRFRRKKDLLTCSIKQKTMSVAELKKEVIKNIGKADERVLKMVNAMLIADQEVDWYDELPDEVKKDLDISLQQEKDGLIIPHAKVMKKYEKWHTK